MRRLPLLLTALVVLCGTARAQDLPWSLEPVAGWREGGPGDWDGPVLGLRAQRILRPRLALRLGLVEWPGRRPTVVPDLRVVEARRLEQTELEAGVEWRFRPRKRVIVGLETSIVVAQGRASDAEEWERISSVHVGWRAAVSSSIRLSPRVELRPRLARVESDVTTETFSRSTTPGYDRVGEHAASWELSLGVGIILGQGRRHAIE